MRPPRPVRSLLPLLLAASTLAALPPAQADPGLGPLGDDALDCVGSLVRTAGCDDSCDGDGAELCQACPPDCRPVCGFQLQDCAEACDNGLAPCVDYVVCVELDLPDFCNRCAAEPCSPCWWEPALCWGCSFQACQQFPVCEGARERACDLLVRCLQSPCNACNAGGDWAALSILECGPGYTCVLSSTDPVGVCLILNDSCAGVLVPVSWHAIGAVNCSFTQQVDRLCSSTTAYLSGPTRTVWVCAGDDGSRSCVQAGATGTRPIEACL